jgi:hypothetical protein
VNPYDRTDCPLCEKELTLENCRWTEFPGICLDCLPPGILRRVNTRAARRGRKTLRPPRGLVRIRWCDACGHELFGRRRTCPVCARRRCACGRLIPKRRRMCAACARAARREAARAGMRRRRAREAAVETSKP